MVIENLLHTFPKRLVMVVVILKFTRFGMVCGLSQYSITIEKYSREIENFHD